MTSLNIIDYLVCPRQSPKCSKFLQDDGEMLRCECGSIYLKIKGIPALRDVDDQSISSKDQLFQESKYHTESFVDMFFLRQYGRLVSIREEPTQRKFEERMFSRIVEIHEGGELFYESLLSLAAPYLKSDSLVIDIGCGTGRLTGELARKGVRFAIGFDYSPLMITGATKVILSEKKEIVNLKIRTTRLQLQDATISGWGLKNCTFVIADAQFLPIQKNTVDFISCINLLHRVKNPKKVVQEIERVVKQQGVLLVSNSYDWHIDYTPQELWFDDFLEQLNPATWHMENELDGIPFLTGVYNRKLSLTFNHFQIFRKLV